MSLGNILKEKAISMAELSKLSGVNYYTLQKFGVGKRSITVDNAKKIGKVLNVNWWLFFEDEEKG